MKLEIVADAEAVARRAVEVIVEESRRAIEARGSFSLAVSGGTTPRRMLALLAAADGMDWPRVELFQVDERVAPDGASERNATMLRETLWTDDFAAAVHAMPVNDEDGMVASARYAALLPTHLDLVQLGLGDDGHTASLVPGDRALDVEDADVALTAEYRGTRRMTLTRPVLRRARAQLWVVTGAGKQTALSQLQDGDSAIPATSVVTEGAIVVADRAAVP